MEFGVQERLQISTDNLLGDTVGDRRYTERSRSCRLGDVHPANRWRKVAPGGQSVPQLVEIVSQSLLERRDRLSIYTSRSLAGLHTLEGQPNLSLRDIERLCHGHEAPPVTGWPLAKTGYRCPFAPAPLQNLHHYYGQLRPCAAHRTLVPRRGGRLGFRPWHRDDRFPRSKQEPDLKSCRLPAGCRSGRSSGLRPNLSRSDHQPRF